jgi:hypothetical protein
MKTQRLLIASFALAALSTLNPQLSTCLAQGSLTPPGAPAPTMITLSQIEPRTPISSAPFTITNPGSYYLTTNLTVSSGNGIIIAASGVTLDLSGFTISSTDPANSGAGITTFGAHTNIAIYNGHISGGVTNQAGTYSGSGFGTGIDAGSSSNVRVSGVSVSGCLFNGINLSGDSSVVQSCVVDTVGGYGIEANSVSDSTAFNCGGYAIYASVANNCDGESTSGSGPGVYAVSASNCRGYNLNGDGVDANSALNCVGVSSSSGAGISAGTAENCNGSSYSGTGVYATSAQNCYGSSSVSGSGVYATSAINCYGLCYGNGDGLDAAAAQSCWGTSYGSGTGVNANTANNCTASSNTGTGLYATRTAIGCDGESTSGTGLYVYTGVAVGSFGHSSTGLGLQAYVANGCFGQNGSGLSEVIAYKYNMP